MYLAAVLGLGYSYMSWTDLPIIQFATRVLLLASSFNAGLILSIGVYRLFFHRLRCFPGPFAAKLSRFYAMSKAAEKVQYHLEVAKMHEKYGDFVRTGRSRRVCCADTLLTNTYFLQSLVNSALSASPPCRSSMARSRSA